MGHRVTLSAHGTEMKLKRENIADPIANPVSTGTTIIFNFAVAAALIDVLFFCD